MSAETFKRAALVEIFGTGGTSAARSKFLVQATLAPPWQRWRHCTCICRQRAVAGAETRGKEKRGIGRIPEVRAGGKPGSEPEEEKKQRIDAESTVWAERNSEPPRSRRQARKASEKAAEEKKQRIDKESRVLEE